jgi:hypothetical protein
MVRHPERPWLAGLAAALATLTRYAGISIVGAVALWSAARRGTLAERLRGVALALLPTLVLQGLWFVRTRQISGAGPIRRLSLYGNLGPALEQGATTLAWWLVPNPDEWNEKLPHQRGAALAAAFVIVLIAVAGAWRAQRARTRDGATSPNQATDGVRLLAATGLLIASYAGVLIASRAVADPEHPVRRAHPRAGDAARSDAGRDGIALWWREHDERAVQDRRRRCAARLVGGSRVTHAQRSQVGVRARLRLRRRPVAPQRSDRLGAHGGHCVSALHQLARHVVLLSAASSARRASARGVRSDGGVRGLAAASRRAHPRVHLAGHRVRTCRFAGEGAGLRVVARRADGVVLAPADDPTPVRRPRSAPPSRPR